MGVGIDQNTHDGIVLYVGNFRKMDLSSTLQCPQCQTQPVIPDSGDSCGHFPVRKDPRWVTLSNIEDPLNQHTEAAYRTYSKHYALFALLAYWIVWRGQIFKHIRFFRDLLKHGTNVVDIATGEGSLTELALFKARPKAESVVAIDISARMLEKAYLRFQRKPVKLLGDVMHLPFGNQSVPLLSCFGGLNSFPSMDGALTEMRRILNPQGRIRGSILLFPSTPWRQKLVREWIQKGYQTVSPSEEDFKTAVSKARFRATEWKRIGDVLLFELAVG